MFDGSHRQRRAINLGGGGPSSSNRRRNRASQNSTLSSRRRTAPSSSLPTATATSTTTTSTTTTTATKPVAVDGIPDRKSELLEAARLQREARRQIQKQNDSARTIQRIWRGYKNRKAVVARLEIRAGELFQLAASSSYVSSSSSFPDDVEMEGMISSPSRQAPAAAAAAEDKLSMEHIIQESSSILSMRLGPTLLPFQNHRNLAEISRKINNVTTSGNDSILKTLLEFESLLSKTCASSSSSPSNINIFSNISPANKFEKDINRSRVVHVSGRIVRISLELLRSLCPPSNNNTHNSSSSSSSLCSKEEVSQRLINLITILLNQRKDDTDNNSDGGDDDDDGDMMVRILNTRPSPTKTTMTNKAYMTKAQEGKGKKEDTTAKNKVIRGETGMILLFLCFKEWFWTVIASSYSSSSPSLLNTQEQIVKTLLQLSCRAVVSLNNDNNKNKIADRGVSSMTATNNEAIAILASALFCSHPHFFSFSLLDEKRKGIRGKNDDGEILTGDNHSNNNYYNSWSKEFVKCYQFYQQKQLSKMKKKQGQLKHINGDENNDGGKEWYRLLLVSLVSTQLSSSSSTTTATATMNDTVKQVVSAMVQDRECILLSNALDLLSSLSYEDHICCKAVGHLLQYVLTQRNELTVLSSLVARGEDIRALLLNSFSSSGGEEIEEEDVTMMEDMTKTANTQEDDEDDSMEEEEMDEEGGQNRQSVSAVAASSASRPPPAVASAATVSTTTTTMRRRQYRRTQSSFTRYTRSQLQTLPMLDKLYHDELWKVRKEILSKLSPMDRTSLVLLTDLAVKIGGGTTTGGGDNRVHDDLLLRLGISILCHEKRQLAASGASKATATSIAEGLNDDESAKKAYTAVLSLVLQSCTGLKARACANSPLLSRLGFNNELLNGLWLYIMSLSRSMTGKSSFSGNSSSGGATEATIATFCDLFAHHLLPMDDEEFLVRYTATTTTTMDVAGGERVIEAEKVILHLRTMLHELYWTRPVISTDVIVPSSSSLTSSSVNLPSDALLDIIQRCHRARLLISGTKVWNSLYERWCRLVHSSAFCDESSWWFPRLVTRERDDDGAVVYGSNTHGDGGGVDVGGRSRTAAARRRMMIDDDDDGDRVSSPMDIDDMSSDDDDDEDGDGMGEEGTRSRMSAADEEDDALADSFKDPKMARVLTSVPQALPFERRVKLFQSLLNADKAKTQNEEMAIRRMMMQMERFDDDGQLDFTGGRERVEIRRDALYNDSMDQLNRLGRKLRRKVQVTFINQHGAVEAGIDGGGVFKEFLDDLIKEAFDPANADGTRTAPPLFTVSPVQTLYVNVGAGEAYGRSILSHYEFLGRVLGKAVYESILVEPQFCLPFLNQLLGKQNTLDDLKNMDPEYYRHLNALRKMNEKDIDSLGLTFELTTSMGGGYGTNVKEMPRTVELIPGGSAIPVTKHNVIRYVHLVAHQRMNVDGAMETRAFLRGFRDLIPASWVRLFSSYELQKVISGDDTVKGIDVQGLRLIMQYSGGYHPSQPTIQWFWEVLEEMTPTQQRKFLKFMTSCSRQPLLGFRALVPLPCIQQVRLREDNNWGMVGMSSGDVRLPTSSTCMNLLKLPNYKSKAVLKEKLLYAIESGAGFELS